MGEVRNWQVHLPKNEEDEIKEHLFGYMEKYFPNAKIEYFT